FGVSTVGLPAQMILLMVSRAAPGHGVPPPQPVARFHAARPAAATAPVRIDSRCMSGLEGLLTGRTLLGRYRVDAVAGRGGMAVVYRGHDERLDRPVAVKVLSTATTDPHQHAALRT